MKKELEFLRGEVKRLNKENTEFVKTASIFESKFPKNEVVEKLGVYCNCKANEGLQLKGVRVAYIGEVESLEACYKEMADSFGCLFCYHSGHCERGKREIESIAEKNDVIFCPVDINSHNACRLVKEACKLRNKPCYFLRSSGLSTLKTGLVNFAAEGYVRGG